MAKQSNISKNLRRKVKIPTNPKTTVKITRLVHGGEIPGPVVEEEKRPLKKLSRKKKARGILGKIGLTERGAGRLLGVKDTGERSLFGKITDVAAPFIPGGIALKIGQEAALKSTLGKTDAGEVIRAGRSKRLARTLTGVQIGATVAGAALGAPQAGVAVGTGIKQVGTQLGPEELTPEEQLKLQQRTGNQKPLSLVTGGQIKGKGTTTSDENLGRVEKGSFIVKALHRNLAMEVRNKYLDKKKNKIANIKGKKGKLIATSNKEVFFTKSDKKFLKEELNINLHSINNGIRPQNLLVGGEVKEIEISIEFSREESKLRKQELIKHIEETIPENKRLGKTPEQIADEFINTSQISGIAALRTKVGEKYYMFKSVDSTKANKLSGINKNLINFTENPTKKNEQLIMNQFKAAFRQGRLTKEGKIKDIKKTEEKEIIPFKPVEGVPSSVVNKSRDVNPNITDEEIKSKWKTLLPSEKEETLKVIEKEVSKKEEKLEEEDDLRGKEIFERIEKERLEKKAAAIKIREEDLLAKKEVKVKSKFDFTPKEGRKFLREKGRTGIDIEGEEAKAALVAKAKGKEIRKEKFKTGFEAVGGAPGVLSAVQIAIAARQFKKLGKRPEDVISTELLEDAAKAKVEAGFGFSQAELALAKQDIETQRRTTKQFGVDVSGGQSQRAFAYAQSAGLQSTTDLLRLRTADVGLRRQKRRFSSSLIRNLEDRKRRIFEDKLLAFQQNQQAVKSLFQAGISNVIGSIQTRKFQKQLDELSSRPIIVNVPQRETTETITG